MQHEAPETLAAFVGLDWADAKHDVCLQAAGSAPREHDRLDHTPEAMEAWGGSLQKRCEGKPIAIGLELNKGPSVFALRTYHFLVLFPLNPLTLARYREAVTPSRAKDDPTDAALQLAWLRTHRDQLPPLNPQSPTMRALAPLVAHRRRVVGDTGRSTHRLTSTLKNYAPQVLHWFQDKDPVIFCAFLSRWPTLKAAQLARRSPLETFLREHQVRSADVIAQRINAIKAAIPLTTDEGIITSHRLLVPALVSQLRATLQAIQDFDHAIAQPAQRHPAFPLFQTRPGAGPVFAPRLLVAFGEQRERYASAAELQQFAGIAPVTERSGKKCWVHWRFQCPTFLRQTFVEWAAESIRHSFWARVYYQQQRDAGKAHQAAVRALAFKWIRILFRCWQDRTPYDESVYLNALNRRGSSLIHNLAKEA
jgi:transposase